MLYAFDTYTLDLTQYELRQAGRLVQLEPRVFNLLAYLVQHPATPLPRKSSWSSYGPINSWPMIR
jgi:DNA-binding winged helix-turn-helix (wHTH) protein